LHPTGTLVVDLDGTLVDTAPDLMAALNMVLRKGGYPTLGMEEANNMIGAGARALVERGLAAVGADLNVQEIDRIFDDFFSYYTDHIADKGRPFPGAVAAIEQFRAAGWKTAVCTNKLEGLSRQLLSELGILNRFDAVGGGDSFSVKKPNPEHLWKTIAAAGGDAGSAVMVGDSETDIATAKAAGIPVVAVDFGYTPVPVETFLPDRVIGHFDELYGVVAELSSNSAP